MKRIVIFFIISSLFFDLKAQAPSAPDSADNKKIERKEYRTHIREGNKLYDAGKASEAETEYRRVLGYEDKSNKAAFNLGDALYRQEKFDKAAEQFKTAAEAAEGKDDKARAYYNWGNSLLKQQKLKEGIDAYKNALRNDPNDIDTKRNLSYALNLLKKQEQEQQNKDKQQNQDQKDQQDKDQDKQNQDQKDQDKQDQQNQQDQKDQQGKQPQQRQISPEDAQRILNALEQEEKDLQEKMQKKERAGSRPAIEKNW